METNVTATSVLVSWQSTTMADRFNIMVTHTVTTSRINQTYTIATEVLNTRTKIEYEDLRPEHNYNICVVGFYGWQTTVSSCVSVQTSQQPIPTTAASMSELASVCDFTLVISIFSFVVALLILLLVVAGVGLAYPRCLRPRVKDTKCLSK